jgi:hypothetical protein
VQRTERTERRPRIDGLHAVQLLQLVHHEQDVLISSFKRIDDGVVSARQEA